MYGLKYSVKVVPFQMSIYDRSSPIPQMNRMDLNDASIYKTECEENSEDKESADITDAVNSVRILFFCIQNGILLLVIQTERNISL